MPEAGQGWLWAEVALWTRRLCVVAGVVRPETETETGPG